MYKIPEERVGQKPDKRSAEYRFAHLQYYDYLVAEKFALLGNATYAKANISGLVPPPKRFKPKPSNFNQSIRLATFTARSNFTIG